MEATICDERISGLKEKLIQHESSIKKMSERLSKDKKNDHLVQYLNDGEYNLANTILSMNEHRISYFSDDPKAIDQVKADNQLVRDYLSIESKINSLLYVIRDTDWKRFDGDVVITDPCYIVPNMDDFEKRTDLIDSLWQLAEEKGFLHTTIYGDWSCTTYNTATEKEIGTFAADGAMVCVMNLSDIHSLFPDYTGEDDWRVTVLHDFHGEIMLQIDENHSQYEGKEYIDYDLHVVGRGNINFKTFQSGL